MHGKKSHGLHQEPEFGDWYWQLYIASSSYQFLNFMSKAYCTQHKVTHPDFLVKGKGKFTTAVRIGGYPVPVVMTWCRLVGTEGSLRYWVILQALFLNMTYSNFHASCGSKYNITASAFCGCCRLLRKLVSFYIYLLYTYYIHLHILHIIYIYTYCILYTYLSKRRGRSNIA